jgi:DNA repair exonuclease SbcCD ATPase subunit
LWSAAAAAGLFIALIAFLLVIQRTGSSALHSRIQALEREKRDLEAQALRQKTAAPAPVCEPAPAGPSEPGDTAGARTAAAAEQEAQIRQLREALAAAAAQAAQFDERAQRLEAQFADLKLENKRLAASEREVNEDLSRANHVINALETELKGKNERLVQVEVANQKLKEQNGVDAQRLNLLMQRAGELQEVHRRREVYLANVLRRYKEVTDHYRALSGVLDSRREPGALNSADLSRIQNAISMAEEDLRQLNSLNAQALRIQQKLTGK